MRGATIEGGAIDRGLGILNVQAALCREAPAADRLLLAAVLLLNWSRGGMNTEPDRNVGLYLFCGADVQIGLTLQWGLLK